MISASDSCCLIIILRISDEGRKKASHNRCRIFTCILFLIFNKVMIIFITNRDHETFGIKMT